MKVCNSQTVFLIIADSSSVVFANVKCDLMLMKHQTLQKTSKNFEKFIWDCRTKFTINDKIALCKQNKSCQQTDEN